MHERVTGDRRSSPHTSQGSCIPDKDLDEPVGSVGRAMNAFRRYNPSEAGDIWMCNMQIRQGLPRTTMHHPEKYILHRLPTQ